MSIQKSNARGEKSSVDKAESTRYGFEPIPATAEVDGASGGNEPTGRAAVEVMDQYTEAAMEDKPNRFEKITPSAEQSEK